MGSCFSSNYNARKELDFAISHGHSAQAVTACLLYVNNINAVLPISKMTALELAVHKERSSIVKQVLDRQASTEPRSNEGWTPLIRASSQGSLDIVKLLIQRGANITARTCDGASCLLLAAKNKHLSVVSYLMEQQFCLFDDIETDGCTSLHHVVLLDDPFSVLKLLEEGVDINARNRDGETPVFLATKHNCTDSLKVLLESGANPNVFTKNGVSPLAEALNQKNTKTVGMLPSFGALVGHKHDDKKSKLIIACCTGSLERVKSLVTKGAKVDVRTPHGLTCLLVAAKNKHRNVVSYFLEQGSSSANDVDADGYTLLHHAVMLNDPHAVSTLIAEGLDVDAKTRDGETPVFLATKHSFVASLGVLLRSGADPNIRTKNGDSALKEAVNQGHIEMVVALQYHGADSSIFSKTGLSPLDSAMEVVVVRILNKSLLPSILQIMNQGDGPSVLEVANNTVELASNVVGLVGNVLGG